MTLVGGGGVKTNSVIIMTLFFYFDGFPKCQLFPLI